MEILIDVRVFHQDLKQTLNDVLSKNSNRANKMSFGERECGMVFNLFTVFKPVAQWLKLILNGFS